MAMLMQAVHEGMKKVETRMGERVVPVRMSERNNIKKFEDNVYTDL